MPLFHGGSFWKNDKQQKQHRHLIIYRKYKVLSINFNMTSDKRRNDNEVDEVAMSRKTTNFTIEHILNRAGNSANLSLHVNFNSNLTSTSSSLQGVVSPSFYNYLPFSHLSQVPQTPQVPRLPTLHETENYATTTSTTNSTHSRTRTIHNFANDKCYQEAQELNDSFDLDCNSPNAGLPFTWLQCTRYCPPKVPRKKEGPQKRQLGRHPRIPFTSHQLTVLEDKFKQSPYLSSEEVTKISRALDLADIRVKIWFQNRRARERREKLGLTSNLSPSRSTSPPSPSSPTLPSKDNIFL